MHTDKHTQRQTERDTDTHRETHRHTHSLSSLHTTDQYIDLQRVPLLVLVLLFRQCRVCVADTAQHRCEFVLGHNHNKHNTHKPELQVYMCAHVSMYTQLQEQMYVRPIQNLHEYVWKHTKYMCTRLHLYVRTCLCAKTML